MHSLIAYHTNVVFNYIWRQIRVKLMHLKEFVTSYYDVSKFTSIKIKLL